MISLTSLPTDILFSIGQFLGLQDAPCILSTGGLPPACKESALLSLAKLRRLQKWWRQTRLPPRYDPSWCFTPGGEWSCNLGEKMYKRFMFVRFPIEHLDNHSRQLAGTLTWSMANAHIYWVEWEDADYFLAPAAACCLDGSLHSWKTLLQVASSQDLGSIGF